MRAHGRGHRRGGRARRRDVVVVETTRRPCRPACGLDGSLERAEAKGKLDSADEVLGRIRVVTGIDELADRELVVEAIVEDEQAKVDLFRRLDGSSRTRTAILASNTSSIPIMKLGVVTIATRSTSSACTSSTRCRCSRSSSSCRAC